jgi:hypothetical protein
MTQICLPANVSVRVEQPVNGYCPYQKKSDDGYVEPSANSGAWLTKGL